MDTTLSLYNIDTLCRLALGHFATIEVIDGRVDLDKYGIRIADDVIYTKTTVEPLT